MIQPLRGYLSVSPLFGRATVPTHIDGFVADVPPRHSGTASSEFILRVPEVKSNLVICVYFFAQKFARIACLPPHDYENTHARHNIAAGGYGWLQRLFNNINTARVSRYLDRHPIPLENEVELELLNRAPLAYEHAVTFFGASKDFAAKEREHAIASFKEEFKKIGFNVVDGIEKDKTGKPKTYACDDKTIWSMELNAGTGDILMSYGRHIPSENGTPSNTAKPFSITSRGIIEHYHHEDVQRATNHIPVPGTIPAKH